MSRWLLTAHLALGCALLTWVAPVGAQPPASEVSADRVAALARQGTEAVKAGRGEEAVRLYLAAYELDPTQSTLLYNIALTYHRVIGDLELARTYYRRFIASPAADPALLGQATRGLDALQQAAPPLAPPPTLPAPAVAPASPSAAPWVLTGIGGALAVGGGVLGAMTAIQHADFEGSADADEKRTLADRGQLMALGADVAIGVGVTAIAVGLIWWALGDDAPAVTARPGLPAAGRAW